MGQPLPHATYVARGPRLEVKEDRPEDALEVEPVVRLKPGSFMELDLTIGALRECAVEDHAVEVEVPVQGGTEPV